MSYRVLLHFFLLFSFKNLKPVLLVPSGIFLLPRWLSKIQNALPVSLYLIWMIDHHELFMSPSAPGSQRSPLDALPPCSYMYNLSVSPHQKVTLCSIWTDEHSRQKAMPQPRSPTQTPFRVTVPQDDQRRGFLILWSSVAYRWATDWMIGGSSPGGGCEFFLHRRAQTGSGVHPASYPMGTRGSFPGGKVPGAWSWPLTSI
jgi:hypothetical protein